MSAQYIIGIDLGGTNLKTALLDTKFRIIDKQVTSTSRFLGKDTLIRAIVDSVRTVISRNKAERSSLLGVGLGLPGPVDFKLGLVHFFPNIPGWKEVLLREILKSKLNLPVWIDNDAKVMALAEYELGAARNAQGAICITLGTGVGGGIILNGEIYRGVSNAAGEIGHLPINVDGPRCNCGGKACLERYVGNRMIAGIARKVFKRAITLEEVSRLAQRGNKPALKVWSEVGIYLGVALSAVVNLLNIDCIVIGGGVSNAGEVLFKVIKETVRSRAMPVQARAVRILRARLGSDAGIIGAAIMVKKGRDQA